MHSPIIVDLFAGAGGLSLGFEQAGLPVSLAAELDPINVATYIKNSSITQAMAIDLSTASAQDILEGTGLSIGDIDVVIGGPPCQGFSVIGSRRMGDPRNQLVFDFLRLASELEARYFVMENVPGFMQGKMATVFTEWMTEAQRLGYSVVEPVWQLNAADFGVPQNRIRCFACRLPRWTPGTGTASTW